MKTTFLAVSLGLFAYVLNAEPTPNPAAPGAGGLEFHHWKRGDEPVKLIRKEEGVCALTAATGMFSGIAACVKVYVADDGYWYLGGWSRRPEVSADCVVVRFPLPPASALPMGSVKIHSASFGCGSSYSDVTEQIQKLLASGTFQATSASLSPDAAPNGIKALIIFCEIQGSPSIFSVGEGGHVSADIISKDARPLMVQPGFVTLATNPSKRPEIFAIEPGMTVLSALTKSEWSDNWDQKHVRLIRDGKVTIINLKAIRADPTKDLKLQAGDVVQVPQSIFF